MSLRNEYPECPLCMEPFEMDEIKFKPCKCGYQICLFCWHRIRTDDENGLCPACREIYPEQPADFIPLSFEEVRKEKRQKDQQKKQKSSESRKNLANVRVVQKNLVFVVGLPGRLADVEILKKINYFGKFGKMLKVVVNQSTSYAGSQGPSASAYVTYCKPEDALRAIKSVNNIEVDGRTLKASLGTTKYCSHFLKNQQCPKTDCMYLHELGDEAASFTKEDMQQGKHQEYEKKLQDQILGCNNRKQTASPPPDQDSTTWPCTVQSAKESRSNRSKDSSQNPKTEGKNIRSKNKNNTSDVQKSKRSKNKSSDSVQHSNQSKHTLKEESTQPRKSQKGKHKDSTNLTQTSGHSLTQRIISDKPNNPDDADVLEMNNRNIQQTTFVHISAEEQIQPKVVSSSIKIARSESPILPPSPISSSSSSLFTPFGSLSSNFMSSSSPSPPPSNNNPLSFGNLGNSPGNQEESSSPVDAFTAAISLEHKPESPIHMYGGGDCKDSLFSHMNYIPMQTDVGPYKINVQNEQLDDKWLDDCSKQTHEDDLDFDPWNESSKGLADLIAKEAVGNRGYTEMATPPGFSQPIKAPVPNQQRIAVPPPGFCSRQIPQNNSLNHLSGMYGPSNTEFLPCKVLPSRQNNIHCEDYYYQDNRQNIQEIPNQYKQYPHQNTRDNLIDNLRFKKNFDERFRNLIPDMFYHLNSRNLPKTQNQNAFSGQMWNHQQRHVSWLPNEPPMLNLEGQRSNTQLWKAIQQLQMEENTPHFNGQSPYENNPFALRGQWPATAQCPPPGFVAPSRSSVNSPFQHMQVNQKI